VRVRIIGARRGEIDGFDLSQLREGIVYNLPTTLAAYLVMSHIAEAATDEEPDRPETMLFRGLLPPLDVAADLTPDEHFLEVLERVCHTSPEQATRPMGDPRLGTWNRPGLDAAVTAGASRGRSPSLAKFGSETAVRVNRP